MQNHQREFIDLARRYDVLRFGDFMLKSGRESPYFFNAGAFSTGAALAALGRCYAQCIVDSDIQFDVLMGPAYKGIPLAAATSIALADQHGREAPFAYNRKEAKTHGEAGVLVGAPLEGRVLVVDDVITAGTAVREVFTLISEAGATLAGVAIGLDRKERGTGAQSAIQELEQAHDIAVISIIDIDHILDYLQQAGGDLAAHLGAMREYRQKYGV